MKTKTPKREIQERKAKMSDESDVVKASATYMTQEQYFEISEGRKVVTPENIGGLIEYPALFHAMQDNRELRPALSEAMTTGRAMADFMGMPPEDFLKGYVVADGPVNPKTGKPYGSDTKAYVEWKATQEKTPVSTEQFNMFGKMADAYNEHEFIKSLSNHTRIRNATLEATVRGVPCACRIDNLYINGGSVFAVDVKTTGDLNSFRRSACNFYYREQVALVHLILVERGIQIPQVRIAAIEKGPMPRCGIFGVGGIEGTIADVAVMLEEYAESVKTGNYGTRYEAPDLI